MFLPKRDAIPKSELNEFKQQTFLVSTIHRLRFGDVTID
jgi:hypothetical protein